MIKKQKSEEDVEKSENTKQWKREVNDEKLKSMQKLKIESSLYNPDKVQVQQTSTRGTDKVQRFDEITDDKKKKQATKQAKNQTKRPQKCHRMNLRRRK